MAERLTDDETRMLEAILARLAGPGADLPPVLFRFITEVTATPNIDLLVRDAAGQVLLAWREDAFGTGWHVPGSIIRHREEVAHRIAACAEEEFGCRLTVSAGPVALIQIFDDRGHSVSLCHTATLYGQPHRRVIDRQQAPQAGDLCWFAAMPAPTYPSHLVYAQVIAALAGDGARGAGIPVFTQHVGARDAGQQDPAGAIGADAPLTRLAAGS